VRLAAWIAFVIGIILIVAVVGGLVMEGWPGSKDARRYNRTEMDIRVIATCVEAWSSDHKGEYPNVRSFAELKPLLEPKYIAMLPLNDAWGHPYRYERAGRSFFIGSAGRDGLWEHPRLSQYRGREPMSGWDADIVYASH
jgi:type II secretory pathway pseudopilin PulG